MSTPDVVLYSNPICPFAHRAWLAVLEKNLPHEFKRIPLAGEIKKLEEEKLEPKDLQDTEPLFKNWESLKQMKELKQWYKDNINETGEVPSLSYKGKVVVESEIVAEFLQDAFPDQGNRLLPNDPYDVAKIRQAFKVFSAIIPIMYGFLSNQEAEKDAEFAEKLTQGLGKFFGLFGRTSEGPYFLGKEFSLADLQVTPFFDRFRYSLKHYRGYSVLPSDDTHSWAKTARAWWAAIEQRESFKKTSQPEEMYLNSYKPYAHKHIYVNGKLGGRGVSNTFSK